MHCLCDLDARTAGNPGTMQSRASPPWSLAHSSDVYPESMGNLLLLLWWWLLLLLWSLAHSSDVYPESMGNLLLLWCTWRVRPLRVVVVLLLLLLLLWCALVTWRVRSNHRELLKSKRSPATSRATRRTSRAVGAGRHVSSVLSLTLPRF